MQSLMNATINWDETYTIRFSISIPGKFCLLHSSYEAKGKNLSLKYSSSARQTNAHKFVSLGMQRRNKDFHALLAQRITIFSFIAKKNTQNVTLF